MHTEIFPKGYPEEDKKTEWSQGESCHCEIEYHIKHPISSARLGYCLIVASPSNLRHRGSRLPARNKGVEFALGVLRWPQSAVRPYFLNRCT
jgi:hypothetical protein